MQCVADYSLVVCESDEIQIHVMIYVDDLIITGSSPEVIAKFKCYLNQFF